MNIFCDLHALGFKGAIYKLFSDRLKHNVYVPIGREWFTEGYWYLFKHFSHEQMDQLANQFLLIEKDKSFPKS